MLAIVRDFMSSQGLSKGGMNFSKHTSCTLRGTFSHLYRPSMFGVLLATKVPQLFFKTCQLILLATPRMQLQELNRRTHVAYFLFRQSSITTCFKVLRRALRKEIDSIFYFILVFFLHCGGLQNQGASSYSYFPLLKFNNLLFIGTFKRARR